MSDDDFAQGDGDPDTYGYPGEVRWIGVDRPAVEIDTKPVHWSELPKPVMKEVPDWDFGDNNKADPAQNLEIEGDSDE